MVLPAHIYWRTDDMGHGAGRDRQFEGKLDFERQYQVNGNKPADTQEKSYLSAGLEDSNSKWS
jgi:hypothetical protein